MTQPARSAPPIPVLARLRGLFSRTPRALRWGLAGVALLAVAFVLLGYFWLPGFAKAQLETRLGDLLHRRVTVAAIHVQPFRLEITVTGFAIAQRTAASGLPEAAPGRAAASGEPLLAFDELTVKLSSASLPRRAPVISAVHLRGPRVNLVRAADGRFNFSDLMDAWAARPTEPSTGGPARFSVSNIQVDAGRLHFVDRLKGGEQDISDIALGLPFIANFASEEETWVQPHFSAKVNGAPLRLEAQARPFAERREATIAANFSGLDLTRLVEYVPLPESYHLLSGHLDANLRATYHQTPGAPPGLRLAADLRLHDAALRNDGAAAPNTLRLEDLHVSLADFEPTADNPLRTAVTIAGVSLQRLADKAPALQLAKAQADAIEIDTAQRRVLVGNLLLDQLQVRLRRQADGALDVTALFAPAGATGGAGAKAAARAATTARRKPGAAATGTPSAPGAPPDAPRPWGGHIASLKLAGAGVRFEDLSLPRVVPLLVEPLDATVTDIDLSGSEPLNLSLAAAVNRRGSLAAKGRVGWSPVLVDLAVNASKVDLVSLQGWASGKLNALLTRGVLGFDGTVKAAGAPLKVAVQGDGRLGEVNLLDQANASDLLRWRSLDIGGLQLSTEPLRVDVKSVALADFFADVLVTPAGQLNLKSIVGPAPGKGAPAAPDKKEGADKPAGKATPATALPVRIGRITLQGGTVNFRDRFIRPNYEAHLTNLAGRVGPLDPGKPGDVEIRGAVNRAAPLEILGKLDPFGAALFLDVTASAKGIDLPNLSPYSGKYVGYAIEKGKLSVDVRYHVAQGQLQAENNIFLDQLTFGEKVDSPDALKVPVNLAVALLKNTRGEIDIHLPVSGSLNDPEFSIGGIIVKVLVNLVVKAVTSPFALLGSLFGGGEELSAVDFPPGHARIAPEREKALEALAKAMNERPGLKLEITGHADPTSDREGLKRAILERKVRAQKAAAAAKGGQAAGSLQDIAVSADEYPRFLKEAYGAESFPKPRNALGFTRSLPVPEMEQLMLTNIPAGEDELRQLAEQRANNVRDWLVERGKVAAERLFVLGAKVEREAEGKRLGSRAEFSLR